MHTTKDQAAALMRRGISRDQAERLVAFVPTALGRQLLTGSEATFSDTYEIQDPDTGRRVRGAFDTEPLYRAAVQYAADHPGDGSVRLIGERSSEVHAARKLLPEGASLTDSHAVFTEPLYMRIPVRDT